MDLTRVKVFQKTVRTHYRTQKRDLPWRHDVTPYRVLVSEVMLQQTQVDRVVPKYKEFIKLFPTPHALSSASLADVLRLWQGLGYNRRAKLLQQTAKTLISLHGGRFPRDSEELTKLPGIGPYSAGAIAAFAYNKPTVFIETNIRTVYLHHFFPKKKNVSDNEIIPLIKETLDREHPREWYSALMDYGAYLKRIHSNPSRRSAHHVRQSSFEGSDRQIRGAIIRILCIRKAMTETALTKTLDAKRARIRAALQALSREGLTVRKGSRFSLSPL